MPENAHCMPENAHCMHENAHCMPENAHCMHENALCMPENAHCMPENVHCIPENAHCMPVEIEPTQDFICPYIRRLYYNYNYFYYYYNRCKDHLITQIINCFPNYSRLNKRGVNCCIRILIIYLHVYV